MKYLKLFEYYNKSDFVVFYKKIMKNIQTKTYINFINCRKKIQIL